MREKLSEWMGSESSYSNCHTSKPIQYNAIYLITTAIVLITASTKHVPRNDTTCCWVDGSTHLLLLHILDHIKILCYSQILKISFQTIFSWIIVNYIELFQDSLVCQITPERTLEINMIWSHVMDLGPHTHWWLLSSQ